jgi:hypothetical protein
MTGLMCCLPWNAQLVGEILPDVEGAPCLGGHNRLGGGAEGDRVDANANPNVRMVDPDIGISTDAMQRKLVILAAGSMCSRTA